MIEKPRTMLLTGASRGIGHATVKLFHDRGWRVLTVSRQPFEAVCPWQGGANSHIRADLADPRSCEIVIGKVMDYLGDDGLDALVNNAAISPKKRDGSRMGILDTDYDIWSQVLNLNLISVALLARGMFAKLKQSSGVIVNVTSVVGTRVHPFAGPAYACSKAALAALTRELAAEFGPQGVRANAIAPGEIATSILSPGTEKIVAESIPLHRLGTPLEVAETIEFLCSPTSSYINGAEIEINGGQHV